MFGTYMFVNWQIYTWHSHKKMSWISIKHAIKKKKKNQSIVLNSVIFCLFFNFKKNYTYKYNFSILIYLF